jgi:hypothetical protein
MGNHPVNLGLRFILEILALFAFGIWGWKQADGWLSIVLAILLPLVAATIWGVFAVPDDPGRSGKTVVPTAGWVRLILELGFFGSAVWAFYDCGYHTIATIFGAVVVIHYFLSYDRVLLILKK